MSILALLTLAGVAFLAVRTADDDADRHRWN